MPIPMSPIDSIPMAGLLDVAVDAMFCSVLASLLNETKGFLLGCVWNFIKELAVSRTGRLEVSTVNVTRSSYRFTAKRLICHQSEV